MKLEYCRLCVAADNFSVSTHFSRVEDSLVSRRESKTRFGVERRRHSCSSFWCIVPRLAGRRHTVMSGLSTGRNGAWGPVMMDERSMTWFGHDLRTASSGAGSNASVQTSIMCRLHGSSLSFSLYTHTHACAHERNIQLLLALDSGVSGLRESRTHTMSRTPSR